MAEIQINEVSSTSGSQMPNSNFTNVNSNRPIQNNRVSSSRTNRQMAITDWEDSIRTDQPTQSNEVSSNGVDIDAIEDIPIVIID